VKKLILLTGLLFTFALSGWTQGPDCNNATPFCTGQTYTFPASTNTTAQPGPDYGCLATQPNPAWYYLQIDQPGNIDISLSNSANVDIDFICWGPFSSATGACVAGLNNSGVDCSYSTAATESCNIPNAQNGDFYLLCITNYSGQPTNIIASQSGGNGTTDCSIVDPCDISAISTNPTACNPANNEYSISGSITFTDEPTTGTLTVTDCSGASQVFNAPFVSPINYTLSGLTSTGSACDITASFSDATCSFTQGYTSPNPCVPCDVEITAHSSTPTCPGSCDGTLDITATGGLPPYQYSVDGTTFQAGNSFSFLCAGSYTVYVSDASGCLLDSVGFVVDALPGVDITSVDVVDELCGGTCDGSLTINAPTGVLFSIDNGATMVAGSNFLNLCQGTFNIVVEDANGCQNTATATVSGPPPVIANFGFNPEKPNIANTTISFFNTSANATSYSWDFDGLGTSTEVNPIFTFPSAEPGTYEICLTATNDNGCSNTICQTIEIYDEFRLYVPNAFTPDGDGVNDAFFPVISGADPDNFEFYIFDRWGQIIYESDDTKQLTWDGVIANKAGFTAVAPLGVYVWKIVARDVSSQERFERIGHVTLVR
jgi:gliding motility-associated-like protein